MFAAAVCCGQVSSRVALSNGIQVSVGTRTSNGTAVALKPSLEPASGDSFYRIFRDENDLAVFAYELEAARTPDGENFRFTAKPAEEDFAARHPNADGGKPTPTLSSTLQSPLLRSGEAFSVPIPSNPGLEQTITDVYQVVISAAGTAGAGVNGSGGGSGPIRFADLKVFIGGKQVSPSGAGADVAGRVAMFYLPGHGGYFFSVDPVESRPFLHVGVVNGKKLAFQVENEKYDCLASAAILTQETNGQLWVYHDPNYKPTGNWTKSDPKGTREEYFTAASDSLRWWLP